MTSDDEITITLKLNRDGLYQALIGGEPCGTARKSVGEAARVAAMSLGAAETKLNSGPDGEQLDQTGLALIMKAMLEACVDRLQTQLKATSALTKLAAGARVKDLMAESRIPVKQIMTTVLETMLSMRMVDPPAPLPEDEALAAELQGMFIASAKSARQAPAQTKPSPQVEHPGRPIKFRVFCNDELVDTLAFCQDTIKIGRLRGSHICIDDDAAARMHAVIEVSGDEVRIIDLGSPVGTIINGGLVNKNAPIKDGDVLTIGPYRLEVSFTDGN